MAGGVDKKSKTEKPTPKRKREARKQGQIARSADLTSWTLVLMATYFLPGVVSSGTRTIDELFVGVQTVMTDPSDGQMLEHFSRAAHAVMGLVVPILVGVVVVSVVMNVAQVGFVLTTKPLKPNFKKLNPITGLKRIFSTRSLWTLGKGLMKIGVIVLVAYPSVRAMSSQLNTPTTMPFWQVTTRVGAKALSMVRTIAAAALVLAGLDYAYERNSTNKQMKMSKQEIKDEHRQQEGNPEMKSKMKARQMSMSRNRMLSLVRMADAVVVNPVHIAVALKYDPVDGAPRVVAKGEGWVAEKIREEADRHQIPIVESIPLARALYATCQVDREIPLEMYEGVARLLAFVHHLGQRRRRFDGSYPTLPEFARSY
jgi:flagellar biosynthetic protein FlhB